MVLRDFFIDGDRISLSKSELEKWRDHYFECASLPETHDMAKMLYVGKRDAIVDILKLFEPLEG